MDCCEAKQIKGGTAKKTANKLNKTNHTCTLYTWVCDG